LIWKPLVCDRGTIEWWIGNEEKEVYPSHK
jgi:hypothetical protein